MFIASRSSHQTALHQHRGAAWTRGGGTVVCPACLLPAAMDLQGQPRFSRGGQRRAFCAAESLLSCLFLEELKGPITHGLGRKKQGSPALWGAKRCLGQSCDRSVGPTLVPLLRGLRWIRALLPPGPVLFIYHTAQNQELRS